MLEHSSFLKLSPGASCHNFCKVADHSHDSSLFNHHTRQRCNYHRYGASLSSVVKCLVCPLAMSVSRRVKMHYIAIIIIWEKQSVPSMHPLYRGCPYLGESDM